MKISKIHEQVLIFLFFVSLASCRKEISNPPPPDPVACFQLNKDFQKPDESIVFTNCSENFDFVEWNFDDGTTSGESNPSHVWNKVGAYLVTLKVSKNNKTASFTKKIVIANQVQIDFTLLMKNFKGAVTNNSFTCEYSAVNSANQKTIFFNLNYQAINNPAYTLNADMSGLYFAKDANVWHRFKVLAKNNQGTIDSLLTDEIDIVESDIYINKSVKLNFCDADYAINLRYK